MKSKKATVIHFDGQLHMRDIYPSDSNWAYMAQSAKKRRMPDPPILGFIMIGTGFSFVTFLAAIGAEAVILAIAGYLDHKALQFNARIEALPAIITALRTDDDPLGEAVLLNATQAKKLLRVRLPTPLLKIPREIATSGPVYSDKSI